MSKIIYIAGPFRGNSHFAIAQNIRRAEETALRAWSLAIAVPGLGVVCPHTNTAHFQDALPDDIWLEGDLTIMRACHAVLLTGDWQRSSGTKAEVEEAKRLGIPVFDDIFKLGDWLGLSYGQVFGCLAERIG